MKTCLEILVMFLNLNQNADMGPVYTGQNVAFSTWASDNRHMTFYHAGKAPRGSGWKSKGSCAYQDKIFKYYKKTTKVYLKSSPK